MATYSTPGVYVEEISTFPPSVAEVSTAIPAFIGYTETGSSADQEPKIERPKIERINTLLEYETLFGKAQASNYSITASSDSGVWTIDESTRSVDNNKDFLMYYALALYFKNGGGSCYIISIGNYTNSHDLAHFSEGLRALEKEDEPTLIVSPDALQLESTDYYALCQGMLAQCGKLGDRFSILDIPNTKKAVADLDIPNTKKAVADFRTSIGTHHLMYGASYLPHLQTALSYHYREDKVTVVTNATEELNDQPEERIWEKMFGEKGVDIRYEGVDGDNPTVQITSESAATDIGFEIVDNSSLKITFAGNKTGQEVATAWEEWLLIVGNTSEGFSINHNDDGSANVRTTANSTEEALELVPADDGAGGANTETTMASFKDSKTTLYNLLKTHLNAQRVVLPPSSAIAGVYARVDRKRGVWKAPANESLSSVIAPLDKITNEEQGRFNVDADAGKSINVIRAFTGKGTLVWGARTLAGNDNEWRYISVRRLFNMIEESSQKSTAFAVFEPNDATTWLKVKAMIESFLFSLWERGALAGPTAEAAYFVNVGLGKTMTHQDILEGRMNVEIGIAAVRPAEFIILKFSHKLQEA